MTDASVECFNCGRANPEWAQVCRSCGVPLRRGRERTAPSGRLPTDRESLLSMAAVLGTILGAVVIGVIIAGLNPTQPSVGLATPTPLATVEPTQAPPSVAPSIAPTATPEPTPVPLPATVVFGQALDDNRQVIAPVETFTPGMTWAHSISSTQPFGAAVIGEEVTRLNEDGTDAETIVNQAQNQLGVDPAATSTGFVAGPAANFIRDWGPGLYVLRVYVNDELIGEGTFRLAEG
ncbi:MAG TPA: hypothetical protein VI277_06560 [Candidatus Limnocylindria bacterium]